MLKKLGILSVLCLGISSCQYSEAQPIVQNDASAELEKFKNQPAPQIRLKKTPDTIIVCRNKQCAPSKLSTSKEYVYNTLLHMLDSNARKKALVCQADSNTHACTEEYVSLPITVGITPAYMYIDDVKITDVSLSKKNTAALDLILNWGVSYNGQTPSCRPSKTLLYVKNVNNAIMEDNGYECKMTTIGSSSIKTLFAIDYIDLDYDYIGGFYSIGVSGPAFGGGAGYMIMRLPEDISVDPKDFQPEPAKPKAKKKKAKPKKEVKEEKTVEEVSPLVAAPIVQPVPAPVAQPAPMVQPVPVTQPTPVAQPAPMVQPVPATQSAPVVQPAPVAQPAPIVQPVPVTQPVPVVQPAPIPAPAVQPAPVPVAQPKAPAPNVDTIIRYNHAARDYDKAKAEIEQQRKKEFEEYEKWKAEQAQALDVQGVKVLPLPLKKAKPETEPVDKNQLTDYQETPPKK